MEMQQAARLVEPEVPGNDRLSLIAVQVAVLLPNNLAESLKVLDLVRAQVREFFEG